MALNLDPAWIAVIGTVGGGIALAVTNHLLNRNKTATDDARTIREELRAQIASQKEEITKLEAEVDNWRNKFYDLRDTFMEQHTELMIALEKINNKSDDTIDVPHKP